MSPEKKCAALLGCGDDGSASLTVIAGPALLAGVRQRPPVTTTSSQSVTHVPGLKRNPCARTHSAEDLST